MMMMMMMMMMMSLYCNVRRSETNYMSQQLLYYIQCTVCTFANSVDQSISFPHYILTPPIQEIIHETASGRHSNAMIDNGCCRR